MNSSNKFRGMSMVDLSSRLDEVRSTIEQLEARLDDLINEEDGSDNNSALFDQTSDLIRKKKNDVRAIIAEMKRLDEHHRYYMSKI